MGADVGWRSSHAKEHFHFKASWIRKYFQLALNQQSYREKALAVMPPVMRICATSNGEQRVQVLIPVVQGLSQKKSLQHLVKICLQQTCHQPSARNRVWIQQ